MVIGLISASLLAATAILAPTLARADGPPRSSQWLAPVGGIDLLTGFDPPPLPWLPGHRGIDLAASDAQQVTAVGDGTVVFADDLAGRGVVSIAHANGLRTTYEPVDPTVAVGTAVSAGDPIGTLQPGHASCPGAVCLHLGLKRGPLYLDPMLLFGGGKVRLLPRPGRALGAAEHIEAETHRAATIRGQAAEPDALHTIADQIPTSPNPATEQHGGPHFEAQAPANAANANRPFGPDAPHFAKAPKAKSPATSTRAAEPRKRHSQAEEREVRP